MKMKKGAVILYACLAVIVSVVVLRFATGTDEVAESIEDIQKRKGVPVNVTTLSAEPFERWRIFSGQVEGKQQAVLYANIPARIRKIHNRQGDAIKPGRTIISLDTLSTPQTYSALSSAQIRHQDAKRMYERMLPLYKAGAISKEEFDQVKSGLKMAKAGLTDMSYTTSLKSPITGTLTDLRVSIGDKVESGQIVATVADLSGAKIITNVSQSDIEELKEGQPVLIGRDSSERTAGVFDGQLNQISISADMETRLFRVEATLETEKDIRPGTLNYLQVRTYRAEEALALPIASVTEKNGESFVYRITPEETCEKVVVKRGIQGDLLVEILSGLTPGDRVVVLGQNRLTSGDKVKIVKDETENDKTKPAA